jgi:hypothetical protein
MARRINGSPEPQGESATPKRKLIKPEEVRVIMRQGGKGSEGVMPGPRQTAYLRKQKK